MAASLPAKRVDAEPDTVLTRPFVTTENGKSVNTDLGYVWTKENNAVERLKIRETGLVPSHPLGYLVALQTILLGPRGQPISPAPREWTNALVDTYRDLVRQREKPGINPQEDWAEFDFRIPPYSRDAEYHVLLTGLADLEAGQLTLKQVPRPDHMEGISGQPLDPPVREPGPEAAETYLTACTVAEMGWILLGTPQGFLEVWEPSGLDVIGVGSSREALETILFRSANGKMLNPDAWPAAREFRHKIRSDPSRRRGRLMGMFTESEVLEYDGLMSRPLYKMAFQTVYNITGRFWSPC